MNIPQPNHLQQPTASDMKHDLRNTPPPLEQNVFQTAQNTHGRDGGSMVISSYDEHSEGRQVESEYLK